MPRDMLFRALKQLSDPDKFRVMCEILDGEPFNMTNSLYEQLARGGLVYSRGVLGNPGDRTYHVTKFGQRLVDYILKADDGEG